MWPPLGKKPDRAGRDSRRQHSGRLSLGGETDTGATRRQLVAQKGWELDARAAAKCKHSRSRAPGEALSGDFGLLDSMFRGVSGPRRASHGVSRGSAEPVGIGTVWPIRRRDRAQRVSAGDTRSDGAGGRLAARAARRGCEKCGPLGTASAFSTAMWLHDGSGGRGTPLRGTRSDSEVDYGRRQHERQHEQRGDISRTLGNLSPVTAWAGTSGGYSKPGGSMQRGRVRQAHELLRPCAAATLFDELFGPNAEGTS